MENRLIHSFAIAKHTLRFLLGCWIWSTMMTLPLSAQQQRLFIANRGGNNILSVPLDSLDAVPRVEFDSAIIATYDMIWDPVSTKVYWTRRFPAQIVMAEIGSGTSSPFNENVTGAVDLEIDQQHQKMYWADIAVNQIFRINLDGTNQEMISPVVLADLTALALVPSEDLMFFSDLDSAAIWSCTLDGNNLVKLVDDEIGYPNKLVVDTTRRKLYWTDDGFNSVQQINFDGSERDTLYQGDVDEFLFGLYLDRASEFLYWMDYGKNRIGRINLETGEAIPVISEGLNDPVAVAIITMPMSMSNDRVNALQEVGISGYPNPADQQINISFPDEMGFSGEVKLFDGIGRLMYMEYIHQPKLTVDVSHWPEGCYAYTLLSGTKSGSGHFVVLR